MAPKKVGAQAETFTRLEAWVRANVKLLAQRHAERPPETQEALRCLLNTLRKKAGEEENYYKFLQRLQQRASALTEMATSRLLWLEGLVLGGPRADEVYLSTPGTKSNIRCWATTG